MNFERCPFPLHASAARVQTDSLRSLVRETRLTPAGFIYPLFICPGEGARKEVLYRKPNFD